MSFKDRLIKAAIHAGVEPEPSPIARSLGLKNRQRPHKWLNDDAEPEQAMIFHIARTYGVDPAWLGSGQGEMIPGPPPGLSQQEQELMRSYRSLTLERRISLLAVAKALSKATVLVSVAVICASPQHSAASALHKNFYVHDLTKVRIAALWFLLRIWSRFLHNFSTVSHRSSKDSVWSPTRPALL